MAIPATLRTNQRSGNSSLAGFWRLIHSHHPRRGSVLDPRELSDHLKRDLGFLDGKTFPGSIK